MTSNKERLGILIIWAGRAGVDADGGGEVSGMESVL
jgi:hypothetical protein